MPRVLRIINRFNLGGPTYNASYLTKYMSPGFHTLLVGGIKDESEENSEFILRNLGIIPVIIPEMHRSINPIQDAIAIKKIKEIIREFKPDIVHTHASKAGALGRRAAYIMNVPVILHTFHGHIFDAYFSGLKSKLYQCIERKLAEKSTKIIALSEQQKYDLVIKYKICPEHKIEIIPLGFDLDKFENNMDVKRTQFRNEYLLDDDEIAIGIIGRVVPVKNHPLFINAIKYVISRSNKKIRAFIVGDGVDRAKIERMCHDLSLSYVDFRYNKIKADITFTSWLKDIDYVDAGMDIITLTSLNEGTPVSLIEAQAAGKPIVSTNVGGIENIIIPNETAWLADVKKPDDFCNKLLMLVQNDELRIKYNQKSRDFVKNKFSYLRLVNDMQNLYHKLLTVTK